jgi:acyl-CoA synthetase (AMP-forming)/AMP-acid ligase II
MWDTLRPPPAEERAAYYAARVVAGADVPRRHRPQRPGSGPTSPAVVGLHGRTLERTLTWAEYAASVERCAAALTELGRRPRRRGRGLPAHRWLLGPLLFACARIGAVSSPVIPVLAGRELALVLDASRAAVCVTVDSFGGVDYDRRLAEVARPRSSTGSWSATPPAPARSTSTSSSSGTPWEQRHPLGACRRAGRTTRCCCSTPPAPPGR